MFCYLSVSAAPVNTSRPIQAAECKQNALDSPDWRGYDHPGTWQQRVLLHGDKVSYSKSQWKIRPDRSVVRKMCTINGVEIHEEVHHDS